MRPGNTALLVITATSVDEHVEAVEVQQVTAHLDAKNRCLGIQREFLAPVPALEHRQVFAAHTRNGKLHGHAAFALANALDLKFAQVSFHDLSRMCIPAVSSSRTRTAASLRMRRWQMSHRSSTILWWAAAPPAARWPPVCRRIPLGRSVCSRRAGPARAGLSMYPAPS